MPLTMPASELDMPQASRSSGNSAAYVMKPSIERCGRREEGKPRSAVLEAWLALLEESRHAFLLVSERELRMEHAPLEEDPFREGALVGAVDRLLDHHHHRKRIVRDLLGHRHRFL